MKLIFFTLTSLLLAASSFVNAQERLIDVFGMWGSEEFEARLDNVIIEASKHQGSKIQLLIYRGEKESLGSPYRFFGKVQAYLNHHRAYLNQHKIPLETFNATFCESKPEQTIEVWLLDSNEIKSCPKGEAKITDTTKFDTAYYAENRFGTCCVSDNFGPQMADASLKAFADLLKQYPDSKGYLFVYGGTDVYSIVDSKGREKAVRNVDKKRDIEKFVQKAEDLLRGAGIDRSRIISINAGYKDSPASVDMWFVPTGGEIPKPTPNYFR